MSGADIAVLIGVLLGGGLLGAILAWVQDRRRGPIERKQAEEATIRLQSEIRTADIDGLRDIIESLRVQVDRLSTRVVVLEDERWTDRAYIRDIHESHPAWPSWRPEWVARLYAPDSAPNFPPTPGSVIEPPRRKEQ